MGKKSSGILLHISSLSGKYGIGDFGPEAYRFADWLNRTKQSCWQVLPLTPIVSWKNPSPYNGLSAFAGNFLFISPDLLCRDGFISKSGLKKYVLPSRDAVNFRKVFQSKSKILKTAFEKFKTKRKDPRYERFCFENKSWLDDFANFVAIGRRFKTFRWCDWPSVIRDRETNALQSVCRELYESIEMEKFIQWIFYKQWFDLKRYCNKSGIKIIGDVPIYVSYQSSDVWSNPQIFKLKDNKKMDVVSGVPPDLFSKTGQLWNNPIYNWSFLKKTGYRWWVKRMKYNLSLFDVVRLDHFRGFVAYWEVPAGHTTAKRGRWVRGQGEDFFRTIFKYIPRIALIAEDLGHITLNVRKLIKKQRLTSMKVLLFAFGDGPGHKRYMPENYERNCVAYTGTHDNNTIMGWFRNEAGTKEKRALFNCIGTKVSDKELYWIIIRSVFKSAANTVIVPMQDVLGLGQCARMNLPATSKGNWLWRLKSEQIKQVTTKYLTELTEGCSRG